MNSQRYPFSVIKKDCLLFETIYFIDDNGKANIKTIEWFVTSIKKKRNSSTSTRYVTLLKKIKNVTWGKLSTKTGDYGWLSKIPSWCKKDFKEGSDLPFGFYTTKLASLKFAKSCFVDEINDLKSIISNGSGDLSDINLEIEENKMFLKAIIPLIKKEKNS